MYAPLIFILLGAPQAPSIARLLPQPGFRLFDHVHVDQTVGFERLQLGGELLFANGAGREHYPPALDPLGDDRRLLLPSRDL